MFQINVKCDPQSYARVMVQSLKYRNDSIWARGAYLLLVPHGSGPIGDRALISFFRNNRMFKIKLTRFIHKGTIAETATVTNIR